MRVWTTAKWRKEKTTRINFNWNKVVLQDKVMPELKIAAQAQAIYDMGMGIPPATRVIKDSLSGGEVVVSDNYEIYGETGWDDFSLARAIMLMRPEILPEWVVKKRWNEKNFRNELNTHANRMVTDPDSPVQYWMDLRVIQATTLKKSGPEAALVLTHSILMGMYLAVE